MNDTLKGTLAGVAVATFLTVGGRAILAGQEKTVWDGVYTEAQAKRGEQLYLERCVTCHGAALEGTELAPSLAGDEFALNWNDLPLNELSERIRVTMPQDQPGVLNRQQTADTVGFMLSKGGFPIGSEELGAAPGALSSIQFLAKKPTFLTVGGRAILAGQEKTVWDGVYTQAQAKRGEQLYLERCVTCHGAALEGTELAPSLAGDEFALNWNDLPLNELSERIRVTMPQDQPGVLNRQQTADTVGFMLSKGGFPIGSEELGAAPGALSSIQFLAKKP